MISASTAKNIINNAYPDKEMTAAVDYNDDIFLFSMVDRKSPWTDSDCPWYGVKKQDGSVVGFNPLDDLDGFSDAMENRKVEYY